MNTARAGQNITAIFAILFLLGFGFVVYAAPETPAASGQSSGQVAATAVSSAFSYALVPTPVYLRQPTPANYSFKEGGALVVAAGDTLQVKTSFLGSPKTTFTTVLQTPDQNITIGRVTTGGDGGGVFKGNVTLQPGTYDVGLLVFVAGPLVSPVGVSVPRTIQVTLRGGGETSGTSTG